MSPPRLALRILSLLLRSRAVNDVLGDLEEVYRIRATSHGVPSARRWYWMQSFRFVLRLTVTSYNFV